MQCRARLGGSVSPFWGPPDPFTILPCSGFTSFTSCSSDFAEDPLPRLSVLLRPLLQGLMLGPRLLVGAAAPRVGLRVRPLYNGHLGLREPVLLPAVLLLGMGMTLARAVYNTKGTSPPLSRPPGVEVYHNRPMRGRDLIM